MRRSILVLVAAAVALAGCSNRAIAPHQAQPGSVGPQVRQTGEVPVNWTHFGWGAVNNQYIPSLLAGPDGNLWATEYYHQLVDKIVPSTGAMTSYALGCYPTGIVSAQDGNLWVLCPSNKLVSVSTSGVVASLTEAYSIQFYADAITLGADGNPWFATTTNHAIGKLDTAVGSITYYIPPGAYGNP